MVCEACHWAIPSRSSPLIAKKSRSFDPNDKAAFPVGYGDEHFIERNTSIDYRIRFQNTGTDTAFNVVIVDTLSAWLGFHHHPSRSGRPPLT